MVYVLYLLEIPLSIVVFIGVIMLAGIMVNDAIVLVDYINVLDEGACLVRRPSSRRARCGCVRS